LSIILLQRNLKENFARERHNIDIAGAALLSAGIIALLYGFLMFGENNLATLACLMASAGFLVVFYFVEKKSGEPIIPFDVFTRTNTIVNIISFLASAVLIAINVYMPLYIQNFLGLSAMVSGLAMAPVSVTWLLASVFTGKAIPRFGEKAVIAVSSLVIAASCLLLPTLGLNSPLLLVIVYTSVMGFGFGAGFTTLTIVVLMSVDYNKRGAATASNSLVRTLGQTIGISIFGSIFNLSIVKYLTGVGIKGVDAGNLYTSASVNNAAYLEQVRSSQVSGLHIIYAAMILIALASLILSFVLPKSQTAEPG
jgi:MFS family permease